MWGTYVPGDAMLLDDVFSLARRVAPRQATTWRPSLRLLPTPREKPPAESLPESEPPQSAPRARSRRRRSVRPAGVGLIERDLLCLQPTFALDHRTTTALVDAVLSHVANAEPSPARVVLDLEESEDIDDDACDALLEIYFRLRARGIRLYVGALPREVFDRLRRNGVVDRLGTGAVWPSLQTALLAAYEDLAGPAVVTRDVVAQLHRRVVPLPPPSGWPAEPGRD